jgi:DNA mismatch repair protein MutL
VAQAPFEYLKPLDNVASKRWPAQGRPILRGGETRNYQIGSAADTDAVQGFLAGPSQEQQPLWSARRFTDLTIIGQFSGTYIVCQAGDDLVLVDQHAAHERIVFEALQQSAHRVESQRLLVPESVELGYVEAEALERLIPRLADMGLEIEPFGGNTFLVKSLPTLLDQLAAAKLLRELAERAVESGTDTQLEPLLDQCRMVMACHGAVRANQRLAAEEMRHLLKRLESCLNSSHCPHGRPTYVRWSSSALAKAFGRLP